MTVLLFAALFISCESKDMKDAKTFIELGDFANAQEKLQTEIKNNPKNTEAYWLLFQSTRHLVYPQFQFNKFRTPHDAPAEGIENISEEKGKKVFDILERLGKLDSLKIQPEGYYFHGLHSYYLWREQTKVKIPGSILSEQSPAISENPKVLLQSAKNNFKICADMKGNLSDNAYLWLYHVTRDSVFIQHFVDNFKKRFPNSDLMPEINYILLEQKTFHLTAKISTIVQDSLNDVISLYKEIKPSIPDTNRLNSILVSGLVQKVVLNHRHFKIDSEGNGITTYSDVNELKKYLEKLLRYESIKPLKISAYKSIAEIYESLNDSQHYSKILQKLLQYKLSNDERDDALQKLGKYYKEQKNYPKAIHYFEKMVDPSDMNRYDLWQSYNKSGYFGKADSLRVLLKNSDDSFVSLLTEMAGKQSDLRRLQISDLDAKFEDWSITITGNITNKLDYPVRNVKVYAEVSDENGNNSKNGYSYLDIIYPNRKSQFDVSIYYGENRPSSIKYGVAVKDFSK